MIQIALIPILGTLILLALCVCVQSRRAAKVAALRRSLEKKVRSIVEGDTANDQTLVENIIRGIGIDQALQQFQATRASLLPGAPTDGSTHWSTDQLEAWKAKSLRRGVESINRGLMVPAILSFLVVVSICAVATTVMYNFQSSGQTAAVTPSPPLPTLAPVPFDATPLPPVLQPPPVPAQGSDAAEDLPQASPERVPSTETPLDPTEPAIDSPSSDNEGLSA
ncbi:MAG: hypothetical protein KDA93_16875 [Planctomycetaceae bacterium]|nr:hypothetical protein [Planctomycetaceae bacterium]